jgi:hypothetical protein
MHYLIRANTIISSENVVVDLKMQCGVKSTFIQSTSLLIQSVLRSSNVKIKNHTLLADVLLRGGCCRRGHARLWRRHN